MFLDANVLVHAALDTAELGEDAWKLLKLLKARTLSLSITPLAVDETMWGIPRVPCARVLIPQADIACR